MEPWDAIKSRRDVRQFTDRSLDKAELERILEAGRLAPSSQNWQPWDFVVVTDRDKAREVSEYREMKAREAQLAKSSRVSLEGLA